MDTEEHPGTADSSSVTHNLTPVMKGTSLLFPSTGE